MVTWLRRHWMDATVVLAAALFIAIGLMFRMSEQPIENGVLTTGRVVDHKEVTSRDPPRETSRFAVIEFRDQRERLRRFTASATGAGMAGELGQVVQVRYDPRDPSRAQWADQPGQGGWKIIVAMALAVLVLGELALIVRRRLFSDGGKGAGALDSLLRALTRKGLAG